MKGFCELTCGRCSCSPPPPPPPVEAAAEPEEVSQEDSEPPAVVPSPAAAAAAAAAEGLTDPAEVAAGRADPSSPGVGASTDQPEAGEEGAALAAEEALMEEDNAAVRVPGIDEFLPCTLAEGSSIMGLLNSTAGTAYTQRALQLAGLTDQLQQSNVQVCAAQEGGGE